MVIQSEHVRYSNKLDDYYCIKRIKDNKLARESCTDDSKNYLSLINYIVIFKTEDAAYKYLLNKVGESELSFYKIDTLKNNKKKLTYILLHIDEIKI